MQIRLKHNIEYQTKGYLLLQQGYVQESHYWLIRCGTIPAVYGSGSSNCYFRFYQQDVVGGSISIF